MDTQSNAPGLDLVEGPSAGARVAWLISYTPCPTEPRLIRQAQSLRRNGWRVVVCGYDGADPVPADWTFLRLKPLPPVGPRRAMRLNLKRKLGDLAKTGGIAARLYHDSIYNWYSHERDIMRLARERPDLRPRLVIAHDYLTCPPADSLARAHGAAVVVDSHEYMREVSPNSPEWVANMLPMIRAMQDVYFWRADQVIAVSQGIADRLTAEQKMKRPARVVRNAPPYQEHTFRPPGQPPTLLYHGIIDPVRDITPAVEAAALWNSNARLILRGNCPPEYARELSQLIAARQIGHKVTLEPPVPYDDIIPRANKADIGYFVYAGGTLQRSSALPNKFFEYVMAGLGLLISDLPEMAALVRRYGLGTLVSETTPAAIARAVDALTPEGIAAFKRASLAAARELCWEREEAVLLEVVNEVCGPA